MKRTALAALLIMSAFAVVAHAQTQGDVQPWTDKWFQPPEMNQPWGQDIASNVDYNGNQDVNQVVMDDWMCDDSNSPVKGFRWWGSYFQDTQAGASYDLTAVEGFYISIHTDILATTEPIITPSHPGDLLFSRYFTVDQLGDYDGSGLHQDYIGNDSYGNAVYEYFVMFCCDPFIQTAGTVYWVSIVAEVDSQGGNVWGWHTSGCGPTHNIDDAVVIGDYDPQTGTYQDWYALEYDYESVDMAFEVIPEPSTILMLIPGLGAIGILARRRKK